MAKQNNTAKTNQNHHGNQLNPNRGTSGSNPDNAQVHGNRGAQLNPNKKS